MSAEALVARLHAAAMNHGVVRLTRSGGPAMASGGTVAYTVNLDGRWVGWVFDERPWLGHTHGGRRWSAAWREVGDSAARWNTSGHRTRAAALAALLEQIEGPTPGDAADPS